MKILFVYPEMPQTCWSAQKEIELAGFKSIFPPLGLLTVAAMLPKEWDKKLIDLNIEPLIDKDILDCDFVFLGGMNVQELSMREVIKKVKNFDKRIVGGGPLLTHEYERFPEIDHLILNEAELTLKPFLEDLEAGKPNRIYQSTEFADVSETPIPLWEIANLKAYASVLIQYSRGCPYMCDFCDVTALFGRKPRTKPAHQIIAELESIPDINSFGLVFFADDNLIGNKKDLKQNLLPELIAWQEKRAEKVWFMTQLTITLADDEEMMDQMLNAGFGTVFIGLETPDEQTLIDCRKKQNTKRNLVENVKYIQQRGFEVWAGFIQGFDNDDEGVFDRQIAFIQETGIVLSIVGLLNAPSGTELYDRMKKENRLLDQNWFFEGATNIIPVMDQQVLLEGFSKTVNSLYSGKMYYERCVQFMKLYDMPEIHKKSKFVIRAYELRALFNAAIKIGILDQDRKYYWKFFFWLLFHKPTMWTWTVKLYARGRHFRDTYRNNTQRAQELLAEMKQSVKEKYISDEELGSVLTEISQN